MELFSSQTKQPLVVAYGMGVDSTAALIGCKHRGIRPDLILFADVGGEKEETYAYKKIMDGYLARAGFPTVTTVRYEPKDFKNYPPYHSLEENCLTNGTLPSLAFGFKSCSQKWKVAPQDKYVNAWRPAQECWAAGGRVKKLIGYDAGPQDMRRRNHVGSMTDPKYDYWYPLVEWGWDRQACIQVIQEEKLPVPMKSACFFCPAMKPDEIRQLPKDKLRRIIIMEARAAPRLTVVEGLWRKGTKARPGSMSVFIRNEGLLPAAEIDSLIAQTPKEITSAQDAFAHGAAIASWDDFFCQLEGESCAPPALLPRQG